MRATCEDMRRRGRRIAAALGVSALALSGLAGATAAQEASGAETSLDEVQAEFSDAFETIGDYTAQEREEALDALGSTLERLDERIDETERGLRDRWSDMSDATREQASEALSDLRDRRNRLGEAYGALSQGSESAWDDLAAGVEAGWSDVQRAWDAAVGAIGGEQEQGE